MSKPYKMALIKLIILCKKRTETSIKTIKLEDDIDTELNIAYDHPKKLNE